MSVAILEVLSPEDLERWRTVSATRDMVVLARPSTLTLTEEEVRRVFLNEYALAAELFEKYQIDPDEACGAKISAYTGAIFVGEGE